MAVYTNVSAHAITTAGGVMMPPGVPVEVGDDDLANERFAEIVASGEIVTGAPKPADPPADPPVDPPAE